MILDKTTGLTNSVAIVGDSWAFGEWYPIEGHMGSYIGTVPVVSHPSPQQYLHEHFNNLKIYQSFFLDICKKYFLKVSYH